MPETEEPATQATPAAPWEYTLTIPQDLRAITVCRCTLRLILTMHGLIGLVDTAELLATELVSNAVRHTKGPVILRVSWKPGTLRVGAWDANPEPPEPPRELAKLLDLEEGRGLGAWSGPARIYGAGSRCPGTAAGASTSGAN
jgi:anti-sigma regulatory factor (Ser/Thr protein kinase)